MRSTTTGSESLKISIAAPPQWTYLAGDTIIGSVNSCSHVVAADAIISLAFIGHAKTLITQNTTNGTNNVHSAWELFDFAPRILHRGPAHIQNNSEINIPFSINIPETASLSARDHAQAESFIPLHAAYIAQHPLSGTFSTEWPGAQLCIDYHLRAQLQYKHDGEWVIQSATAPITLGHPTIDSRTICFALQRRSISSRIDSHRLLPPLHRETVSLTQKTRRMFGLSKDPRFCFTVDMLMPLHIQLDNPTPMPLILRVVPLENGTSAAIKDIAQTVTISYMELSILSKVEIIYKPTPGCHKILKEENVFTQHLGLKGGSKELDEPSVIVSGPRDQQLNIGSMLQLVLGQDGLRRNGMHLRSVDIQPSFVTFNIKLSHKIIWDVTLDIAGETTTLSAEAGVTIHNSATRL